MIDRYKVVAVTFAGRRATMELLAALVARHHGLIDEWLLFWNVRDSGDEPYVRSLPERFPWARLVYKAPGHAGFHDFYRDMRDPGSIYVDVTMGIVTQQVLNYVSGGSGPGVNVTTNFSHDDLGRPLLETGPSHTVVISGTATAVQPVTSYAYSQSVQPASGTWAPDQNTTASGYYDGTSYTLIDPVTVTNVDKDGRTIDRITSHRTTGSGLLSPADTYAQTDWQTWASTQYGNTHQTLSDRVYFLIPASGAGTLATNYGQTDYAYNLLEQRSRVAVWASATAATVTCLAHRNLWRKAA